MTSVKDTVDAAQDYQLPPPEPLRRVPEAPDPYPLSALDEVLDAAQGVLATATLAVQPHANLLIDGRRIPLVEFFISVGELGVRKIASDQAALAPVAKRQRKLLEKYEQERQKAEVDTAIWKKSRDDALRQKDRNRRRPDLEALGPPPELPAFPMLTTEEPTYEGLVKLLEGGGRRWDCSRMRVADSWAATR